MTMTIELNSDEEVRLAAAARQEGLDPAELARRLVVEHLPSLIDTSKGKETSDVRAVQAAGAYLGGTDGEDALDWDAWTSAPPHRRTGSVRAKLQHMGRAKPMPADDPWAK